MANLQPVTSQAIGKQVLDALGINVAHVTKLSLHFEVNEPVRCFVESLAGRDGINAVTKVLQEFQISSRPGLGDSESSTS